MARRTVKRRTRSRPSAKPPLILRELRAELELLKRKVDNLESEMRRRFHKPIRPAFPDVEPDDSE